MIVKPRKYIYIVTKAGWPGCVTDDSSRQDIAGGGGSHQAQDSSGLYYLETADPASAAAAPVDIFNLSYIGPAGAGAGAGVSPSYSLPLSPSSSSYSEYSDPGAGQGAGQQCYTININIADIESQVRLYLLTVQCYDMKLSRVCIINIKAWLENIFYSFTDNIIE